MGQHEFSGWNLVENAALQFGNKHWGLPDWSNRWRSNVSEQICLDLWGSRVEPSGFGDGLWGRFEGILGSAKDSGFTEWAKFAIFSGKSRNIGIKRHQKEKSEEDGDKVWHGWVARGDCRRIHL